MEDKKEWVSTSELYKLMSEEQRKNFTERLRHSPEIAFDCFQNPSMLKQFTKEDREAIYSNWSAEQRDYFCLIEKNQEYLEGE